MEIILKDVRLSFPALFAPQKVGSGEGNPAYGAKLIIDPASAEAKLLAETMAKVAEEKWPAKGASILKQLIADKKVCFVEGPYVNKDGEIYDGYEGMYSLSTRSEKLKPTVKDRFNNTVEEGAAGAPYNGCYVHAAIDVWAQDNQYGRRINATLQGVMFARDGDSFSGGRPANDGTFANLAQDVSTADFV